MVVRLFLPGTLIPDRLPIPNHHGKSWNSTSNSPKRNVYVYGESSQQYVRVQSGNGAGLTRMHLAGDLQWLGGWQS